MQRSGIWLGLRYGIGGIRKLEKLPVSPQKVHGLLDLCEVGMCENMVPNGVEGIPCPMETVKGKRLR